MKAGSSKGFFMYPGRLVWRTTYSLTKGVVFIRTSDFIRNGVTMFSSCPVSDDRMVPPRALHGPSVPTRDEAFCRERSDGYRTALKPRGPQVDHGRSIEFLILRIYEQSSHTRVSRGYENCSLFNTSTLYSLSDGPRSSSHCSQYINNSPRPNLPTALETVFR
ncbi:hypothetical protein BJ165DRAFT_1418627 [Panaeolus papilionaceus]|nr:hypothetical protein BJ165DRAFT_1418627 [Panaeolus papilionaceus]